MGTTTIRSTGQRLTEGPIRVTFPDAARPNEFNMTLNPQRDIVSFRCAGQDLIFTLWRGDILVGAEQAQGALQGINSELTERYIAFAVLMLSTSADCIQEQVLTEWTLVRTRGGNQTTWQLTDGPALDSSGAMPALSNGQMHFDAPGLPNLFAGSQSLDFGTQGDATDDLAIVAGDAVELRMTFLTFVKCDCGGRARDTAALIRWGVTIRYNYRNLGPDGVFATVEGTAEIVSGDQATAQEEAQLEDARDNTAGPEDFQLP